MPTDISGSLPELDFGGSYFVVVDANDPAAIVTSMTVSGTYYPPGDLASFPSPAVLLAQEPESAA